MHSSLGNHSFGIRHSLGKPISSRDLSSPSKPPHEVKNDESRYRNWEQAMPSDRLCRKKRLILCSRRQYHTIFPDLRIKRVLEPAFIPLARDEIMKPSSVLAGVLVGPAVVLGLLDTKIKAKGKKYFGSAADPGTIGVAIDVTILTSDYGAYTPENSIKWDAT